MKRKELAQFEMLQLVNMFLQQNMHLQEEIKHLKENMSELHCYCSNIQEFLLGCEVRLGGMPIERSNVRKDLITLALKINRLHITLERRKENYNAVKALHCSKSDLRRATDIVLETRCRLILNAAAKNKKALHPFGLHYEMLHTMESLMKRLKDMLPNYTLKLKNKITAHNQARATVREACRMLKNETDNLMDVLPEKFSNEKSLYKLMRRVICYGRKRKAYGGRFKDKHTGVPLDNVQISVVETAEKIVSDFANKVTVVIEKAGYKKVVLKDVDVMLLNELTGEMEPENVEIGDEKYRCFE